MCYIKYFLYITTMLYYIALNLMLNRIYYIIYSIEYTIFYIVYTICYLTYVTNNVMLQTMLCYKQCYMT